MILGSDGRPAELPPAAVPAWAAIQDALVRSAHRFARDPARHGLDVLCLEPVAAGPNRARVKVFAPDAATVLAFLYKDSQVPVSTDRFAYGALVVKNRLPEPAETDAVIAWIVSGFHPENRPAGVKRAFPFTIPR